MEADFLNECGRAVPAFSHASERALTTDYGGCKDDEHEEGRGGPLSFVRREPEDLPPVGLVNHRLQNCKEDAD